MRRMGNRATNITVLLIVAALVCLCSTASAAVEEFTYTAGRFGTVHLYRSTPRPRHVVLFISGDGGWNLGVVDMARALAGLDALVVGVDITDYLKQLGQSGEACLYPAADFESLSKYVQKRLGLDHYIQPILVGYSSGATLVYALICQAPDNTFKAAISMGFCPDLTLPRPPCKGNGLIWQKRPDKGDYVFKPADHLPTPWIAFQGEIDQVCDAGRARDFAASVPNAQVVTLLKVGHGFSVPANWFPQFKRTFAHLAAPSDTPASAGISDLPLVEVPARASGSHQLVVMISGDGGWAGIDRELSKGLAERGLPVVGIDSLAYFWTARTPEGASKDLARILRHYLPAWHKEQAILIGYSLGADVLPFMTSRLPADLQTSLGLIVLLGPGHETAFEFHVTDWFGLGGRVKQFPLLPEMSRLPPSPTLCIYGERESDTLCRETLPPSVQKIGMGGGHHFGRDVKAITEAIIRAIAKQ
ncbi:MAG: virulence factor family protein [Desulfatitalea sp.]|nr:virulence factor family protein [Desulfatitalea sp.]